MNTNVKKVRLDRLLVERGLAATRPRAKALIMAGRVMVRGLRVDKAGTPVPQNARITLKEKDHPFVSRGGLKLKAALDGFGVEVAEKTAMDVGASTGGFTDCLLTYGAKRVYAIDTGYGKIALKLRDDPRVVLFERTNIRHLEKERIPEEVDLIAIDTSFISLTIVIPAVLKFLKPKGEIVALIKPQFELEKGQVGKRGIVRDEGLRAAAVEKVVDFSREIGLTVLDTMECPIHGAKGNVEYFLWAKK